MLGYLIDGIYISVFGQSLQQNLSSTGPDGRVIAVFWRFVTRFRSSRFPVAVAN
jgi:hypothetical protein